MNNSIGTNVFKRDFLVENFIRFKENLNAPSAETIFLAECLIKNQYAMLCAFPFCLNDARAVNASSTWRDDFQHYEEAIDELLSVIGDKATKDKLKFQFLKEYWRCVNE